jgi:hypothetical protein
MHAAYDRCFALAAADTNTPQHPLDRHAAYTALLTSGAPETSSYEGRDAVD